MTYTSIVRGVIVGNRRIELDSFQTFDSVRTLLGPTPMSTPQSHNDSYKLCYQLNEAPQFLIIESDEMGGPEHEVLGFQLRHDRLAGVNCSRVRGYPTDAQTNNSLALDMSARELIDIVGTPEYQTSDSLHFVSDRLVQLKSPRQDTTATEYEEFGRLFAKLDHGSVVAIAAWFVTLT